MGVSVIILVVLLLSLSVDYVFSELLLVHTIFRHGEKTVDSNFMPPTDPYKNHTFYPYGANQLTNEGKKTMYNFGKILRKRYGEFLGDMYTPGLVDAWSSSIDRCQASLQLVFTSLFPPNGPLLWNKHLNWQPIPYQSLLKKYDNMFLSILTKIYVEEYNRYVFLGEGKKVTDEAKLILSYIQHHTNSTMKSLRDILLLHVVILGEENYGLTLPEWMKKVYPHPINDLVILEYELQMGTRSLRRQLVGRLMKKILEDSENYIKNRSNCKLHLYSGHDFNLMNLLTFLGLMYNHQPGYAACMALELHQENGSHFLEVHYKSDKHSNFRLMHFPNGEKRLYLHHFRNMVEDLFEEDEGEEAKFNVASGQIKKRVTYLHLLIMVTYAWYSVN